MRLTVTQEDIDNGVPNMGESCPIARALRRRFPGAGYVSVGLERIRVDTSDAPWGSTLFYADTSKAMRRFILAFDSMYRRRGEIRPRTFILEESRY